MKNGLRASGPPKERGATLVFLGLSLVAILGVMSLAVDLGMLYVGRDQAQRAADAAALAGADSFATSGCLALLNCTPGGPQEPVAEQQAIQIGSQNLILEQPAQINAKADISFNYPFPYEPQITVTVQRTTARGNAVPTIFAKIFGTSLASVSATATAEAFNGPAAQGCVAPFLVPNCNPNPAPGSNAPPNKACAAYTPGTTGGTPYPAWEFIAPGTAGPPPTPATVYTSAIGQDWQLHFSTAGPSAGGAPSQWYMIAFVNNSGNAIANEILQCSPQPINCWDTLNSADGKKVGPITAAVDLRIHASSQGLGNGQDTIISPLLAPNGFGPGGTSFPPTTPPAYGISILAGSGNPNFSQLGTTPFPGPSSSLVTVPVYQYIVDPTTGKQTTALSPGGSTVQVIGFMQLFLVDAYHAGQLDVVDSVITDISGCDSTPATVSSPAGVPIRLIRTGS